MRRTLIFGAAALFAATAALAEVTIATASGPVTLPENPSNIAVLDVAAIDTLGALGIDIAGVPNRLYVPYLDDTAASARIVGTLFEPDFETLAVMAPDLIVAGGRSSVQAAALARIAPTIDMTITAQGGMAQARARIDAYGALFGRQEAAARLGQDLDNSIAAAQEAVRGKGNALILLTNGNKVSAYGAGSRFGWLHDVLDLPEAARDLEAKVHGQAVSFEFIAQVDPDWLLVVDRGAAIGQSGSAQATLDNPLVARTSAARNGRIVYLDAAPLYVAGGGARSILRTLGEITAAFGGRDG